MKTFKRVLILTVLVIALAAYLSPRHFGAAPYLDFAAPRLDLELRPTPELALVVRAWDALNPLLPLKIQATQEQNSVSFDVASNIGSEHIVP